MLLFAVVYGLKEIVKATEEKSCSYIHNMGNHDQAGSCSALPVMEIIPSSTDYFGDHTVAGATMETIYCSRDYYGDHIL